jgi:hypothetical protein
VTVRATMEGANAEAEARKREVVASTRFMILDYV